MTKSEAAPLPVLYTANETARILSVHPNYLRLIPATDLKYYLVGGRRKYKQADLDAYIESRVVGQ